MIKLAIALIGLPTVFLSGCSGETTRYGPSQKLSDDDLVAYALKARQDSFREGGGRRIIGIHNGTRVVADFPFLDDGQSTLGFIHYDVELGEACKRAGGTARLELVPAALTATEEPYCVPKILVDRRIRITPLD